MRADWTILREKTSKQSTIFFRGWHWGLNHLAQHTHNSHEVPPPPLSTRTGLTSCWFSFTLSLTSALSPSPHPQMWPRPQHSLASWLSIWLSHWLQLLNLPTCPANFTADLYHTWQASCFPSPRSPSLHLGTYIKHVAASLHSSYLLQLHWASTMHPHEFWHLQKATLTTSQFWTTALKVCTIQSHFWFSLLKLWVSFP